MLLKIILEGRGYRGTADETGTLLDRQQDSWKVYSRLQDKVTLWFASIFFFIAWMTICLILKLPVSERAATIIMCNAPSLQVSSKAVLIK